LAAPGVTAALCVRLSITRFFAYVLYSGSAGALLDVDLRGCVAVNLITVLVLVNAVVLLLTKQINVPPLCTVAKGVRRRQE
jgi:hypothetical protein